jgi:hypothetical protein
MGSLRTHYFLQQSSEIEGSCLPANSIRITNIIS